MPNPINPARPIRSALAAIAAIALAHPSTAQSVNAPPVLMHVHEPFFVFPDFVRLTVLGMPWHSFAAIVILSLALLASLHRRSSKERHKQRIAILGVGRGQTFMLLDVMCHAVWRGRVIDPDRLDRAVEFARDNGEIPFTREQFRDAAMHADRLITPLSFSWMRKALLPADRRRIFETALAVMIESGPLSAGDRSVLRTMTKGLAMEKDRISDLRWLLPA